MGKYCEVCGKGVVYGNNVSHSNRKTRRTWAPSNSTAILHSVNRRRSAVIVNAYMSCLYTGYLAKFFGNIEVHIVSGIISIYK